MYYRFNQPGLVVLEGLDSTGKSTQAELFKDWPNVLVEHQPSGAPGIGKDIYALTENAKGLSPIARQFLHLACHAQHYENVIIPAVANGKTVIMDRFWWSTVAYGFYDAQVARGQMSNQEFVRMARLPMRHLPAPLVIFLFNKPYANDPHNTPDLGAGYSWLAQDYWEGPLFTVPVGTVEETQEFIIEKLLSVGGLIHQVLEGEPDAAI